MIRPDDMAPVQRARLDSARMRLLSTSERIRKQVQDEGASDAEAATVLVSALATTIGDVLLSLVPAGERAELVALMSRTLHVELMKEAGLAATRPEREDN